MEEFIQSEEFSDFQLNKESPKISPNNSKKSKSSGNSLSLSDVEPFEKEVLKTIDEMKRESHNFIKNPKESYDLDEKVNFKYIKGILETNISELSNQKKIDAFNDIMYKLAYEDRILLLDKYKDLFAQDENLIKYPETIIRQEKKLKEVFILLLKDIIDGKPSEIKELFQTKYYVNTQSSKIPFLEGSEEYIFTNLINDAYNTFITNSNYPKNEKVKAFDENKELSNYISSNATQPIMKPIKIIENNNNINSKNIEENMIIENEIISDKLNPYIFKIKKFMLLPIFELYCSKEFQDKYEEYLMKNNDKRIKYIYEIILESLFYYSINFNEEGKMKIISDFSEIFYETEQRKLKVLKKINYDDFIEIKDLDGNDVDTSKGLKNITYKVKINNYDFDLNFYDYNINNLLLALINLDIYHKNKKEYIENILNDSQYWTIQKYATVNRLYNNNKLNELSKEEIDSMLKHKVLENVFNEIPFFQSYQYPFITGKFLKQVHDSIVFVKLPTKLILGLTIKKMGIIIINKGRYSQLIDEQKNKNVKYALKLSEFSFYKITFLHEVNFHYFLVILYSNNKISSLNSPEIVYKNYIIDKKEKYDFGDKGEAMIFGKKVSELYINGVVNIINLDLWNKNIGIRPIEIGKKFMKINKETKNTGEFTIQKLIELSKFTEYLYEIINNNINMNPFILNSDINDFFSRGQILSKIIDEFNIEGCLNAHHKNNE